jgi:transposase
MTKAQILQAKFFYTTGCALENIADAFGVSVSTIKEIVS